MRVVRSRLHTESRQLLKRAIPSRAAAGTASARLGVHTESRQLLKRAIPSRAAAGTASARLGVHTESRQFLKPVTVIAITGGPCGGKTSALVELAATLPGLGGVNVMTAPEFSTLFFQGGCPYPAAGTRDSRVAWDLNKLKAQMAFEDAFRRVAESRGADSAPVVILVDRGVMDTKAFVSKEAWKDMLKRHGWDEEQFLRRYDSVIHLVSTAIGAEEHYNGANNDARRETAEEAGVQDRQIRDAWMQHPDFRIVSNRDCDFGAKLIKVVAHVCEVAGLPTPVGTNKQRWLVKGGFQHNNITEGNCEGIENIVAHHVETDFIAGTAVGRNNADDVCIRRRRRLDEDEGHQHWIYSVHERRPDGSTRSRPLARREYNFLKNLSREDTMVSKMTSFIFEETLWKLDEFCGEADGDSVCVLTLEAGSLMTEPPSSCFSVISRVGNLSLREVRDTLLLHSET